MNFIFSGNTNRFKSITSGETLAALSIALCLSLSACAQSDASEVSQTTPVTQASVQENCMDLDFNSAMTVQAWRSVNDGVMGGLSSGGPRYENESLIFEGLINTNGGGFSSIRLPLSQGSLAGYSGLRFRIKSDGRIYKLTLRGSTSYRGRSVSFQAPLPATPEGEWADVMVEFNALKPTLFGQALRGVEFDITQIQEMGLIIADGKDGPFRLEVKSLGACQLS